MSHQKLRVRLLQCSGMLILRSMDLSQVQVEAKGQLDHQLNQLVSLSLPMMMTRLIHPWLGCKNNLVKIWILTQNFRMLSPRLSLRGVRARSVRKERLILKNVNDNDEPPRIWRGRIVKGMSLRKRSLRERHSRGRSLRERSSIGRIVRERSSRRNNSRRRRRSKGRFVKLGNEIQRKKMRSQGQHQGHQIHRNSQLMHLIGFNQMELWNHSRRSTRWASGLKKARMKCMCLASDVKRPSKGQSHILFGLMWRASVAILRMPSKDGDSRPKRKNNKPRLMKLSKPLQRKLHARCQKFEVKHQYLQSIQLVHLLWSQLRLLSWQAMKDWKRSPLLRLRRSLRRKGLEELKFVMNVIGTRKSLRGDPCQHLLLMMRLV